MNTMHSPSRDLSSDARSVLLVKSGGPASLPEWQRHFAEFCPSLQVHGWQDDSISAEDVHYALVWQPEPGRLARYPHLRLILSSAAGVDHILADPALPLHLPIVRMVTPETTQRMGDYVLMSALMLLRQMPSIVRAQREQRWDGDLKGRMAVETTIGLLGLGQLGAHVAKHLAMAGFTVQGWARTEKSIEGVRCLAGEDGFASIITSSDIIVNLLPDTTSTRHILNASTFARMKHGTGLINVGRANQIDSPALLEALNSGQIGGAVLDVFETEPLPAGHPLWTHPSVIITPHIASDVSLRGKARQVASVIAAAQAGRPVPNLFSRTQGY